MLITSGTKGQFGNAYLSSAYYLAHAIEHGYRLRLYNLGPYRDYLSATNCHLHISIGGKFGNLAGMAGGLAYRKLTRQKITRLGPLSFINDLGGTYPLSPKELAAIASSGITISTGWKFRDRSTLKKHIVEIRRILAFKRKYLAEAQNKMREIRGDADHVIAVHIRMGDYQSFRDGKYLFSAENFQHFAADAVAASGHDPAKVAVLPFSNETLGWPKTLEGAKVHMVGGSWWEDFLCLSMSDLIIGPPSTFSGSASLLGDVPWFQIKDKDASFDLAMARPYLESGIRV